MQTITKTFNIYNFDELSKEIQEELIKKEAEGIRKFEIEDFLEREMEQLAITLLEEKFGDKAIYKNVCYSLSYCQGDGAMIEFELTYCGKNVEVIHDPYCRRSHANSFQVVEKDKELTELQYNALKEKIYSMNKELAEYGYQFIEEDRTEQAILQLKDCMFYKDGTIY